MDWKYWNFSLFTLNWKAKIEEIKNSLELALHKESFDQVIIHAGTNNLSNTRTNQITTGVFDLVKMPIKTNPDIRVSISSLIVTRNADQSGKIRSINNILKSTCDDKGWLYIDNSHIRVEHLKYNSIHLNKVGVKLLASNFIRQALRPLNGSKGSTTVNFPKPVWELAKALNRISQLT